MQLFYNPELSESSTIITFNKDESRHIVKVLRKKEGDILHITNGKGWLFSAILISTTIKQCSAAIKNKQLQNKHNYNLHLAVAPTKMNDRYEWFLEKATEIGIDTITPIICDHSERKIIKPERFNKIIQAATKQSLHCYMPELKPAISLKAFLQQPFNGARFIAHCENSSKKTTLKTALKHQTDFIILIGPEGDFSANEIEYAIKNHFTPVSLGNTRLRTETAAIVACHSVAYSKE